MDTKKIFITTAFLCLFFIVPMVLPQIVLLSGWGYWRASFDLNLISAVLLIPLGLTISLLFCLFKKFRKPSFHYAIAFFFTAILFIPSFLLAEGIRSYAFYLAGLRAQKIIVAIEQYRKINQSPPRSLEVLMPEYLDSMPSGVPPLKLIVDDKNPSKWSLSADVGTGILNWDEFIYRSDKDYSSYEDSYKKLGEWIYYYE